MVSQFSKLSTYCKPAAYMVVKVLQTVYCARVGESVVKVTGV